MNQDKVVLLKPRPYQPVNELRFSDGRSVMSIHDGAPCPRCATPLEYRRKINWKYEGWEELETSTE